MEIVGETIDDAAGEAFDKAAKMLGLPYPGGPLVDKYAKEGNPLRFSFSEPNIPDLNYSFSGLKTSILYFLRDQVKAQPDFISQNIPDLCASIQHTIIRILLKKAEKAVKQYGVKHIAIAGGVSANSGLRTALAEKGKEWDVAVHIPPFEYCTDNAAMIAMAGAFRHAAGLFSDQTVAPLARMEF
jgi:N6-L-threonylcarbamoyladenine synthase